MEEIKESGPLQSYVANAQVTVLLAAGSCLFVGLKDGRIEQWDSAGEIVRVLHQHSDCVRCLLRCGYVLWSGSDDGSICFWNTVTGEHLNTTADPLGGEVRCFAAWGEYIISGSRSTGGHIRVWSQEDGTCVK